MQHEKQADELPHAVVDAGKKHKKQPRLVVVKYDGDSDHWDRSDWTAHPVYEDQDADSDQCAGAGAGSDQLPDGLDRVLPNGFDSRLPRTCDTSRFKTKGQMRKGNVKSKGPVMDLCDSGDEDQGAAGDEPNKKEGAGAGDGAGSDQCAGAGAGGPRWCCPGGDMIKYIMLTQRVDRPQAVEILEANNAALDEEEKQLL
jgi:hypothetical protein